MLMLRSLSILGILAAGLAAQAIQPPYAQFYSFVDLGGPTGVPTNLGGVTFKFGQNDTLYVGGAANQTVGAVYTIKVTRDPSGHITGFSGSATKHADAPSIDGGLQFGPGGVLFFTRYSNHELGMIKPSSTTMDKSVPLGPTGLAGSVGSLGFVPAGFPGVNELKVVSYNGGRFANLTLTPDAQGTFDVTGWRLGTTVGGGPEGFFYVAPNSPGFTNFTSMLVCEYGSGEVAVYTLDAMGDPVPASRQVFMTGLSGCEGAAIDPLTGDFLFSTFGGSNRIIAVRGFGTPCGTVTQYGAGVAGSGGNVPQLDPIGCFARNQQVTFSVTKGLGGAPGALFAGLQQQSVPIFGGTWLVVPFVTLVHSLNGSGAGQGTFSFVMTVPNDTFLLNTDFFFQSVYLDTGAPQSISFTRGTKLDVR